MPTYHLQPFDLLFFRDARPMESQSLLGGHGARWPHPAVFFDALHAALWRAFPGDAEKARHGFVDHSFYRKKSGQRHVVRSGGTFFQSLTTAGPFPVLGGRWFFPLPADIQPGGGRVLPITEHPGQSDLPQPFKLLPLGSTSSPSKKPVAPWWSKDAIEAYLAGSNTPAENQAVEHSALFASEWTTGIGMDSAREVQDGERIYSAQYLRLRDEARLGLWASLPQENGDGMNKLFPPDDANPVLVAGGQQRICHVERQNATDLTALLPVSHPLPLGCTRVKWVLLSPAVFPAMPALEHPGGWLPTWIHPADGGVLLNEIKTDSASQALQRAQRRNAVANSSLRQSKLIAACIPKPVALTGWTESLNVPDGDPQKRSGPRATQLAVAAGAAYYFECPSPEAAQALWELLSWHGHKTQNVDRVVHRRSSLLGEKGFGLGVCADWKPFAG